MGRDPLDTVDRLMPTCSDPSSPYQTSQQHIPITILLNSGPSANNKKIIVNTSCNSHQMRLQEFHGKKDYWKWVWRQTSVKRKLLAPTGDKVEVFEGLLLSGWDMSSFTRRSQYWFLHGELTIKVAHILRMTLHAQRCSHITYCVGSHHHAVINVKRAEQTFTDRNI